MYIAAVAYLYTMVLVTRAYIFLNVIIRQYLLFKHFSVNLILTSHERMTEENILRFKKY